MELNEWSGEASAGIESIPGSKSRKAARDKFFEELEQKHKEILERYSQHQRVYDDFLAKRKKAREREKTREEAIAKSRRDQAKEWAKDEAKARHVN